MDVGSITRIFNEWFPDKSTQISIKEAKACETQDPERAFEIYRDAANAGDPEGQYLGAVMLTEGRGTQVGLKKAYEWLKSARKDPKSDYYHQASALFEKIETLFSDPLKHFDASSGQEQSTGVSHKEAIKIIFLKLLALLKPQATTETEKLTFTQDDINQKIYERALAAVEELLALWKNSSYPEKLELPLQAVESLKLILEANSVNLLKTGSLENLDCKPWTVVTGEIDAVPDESWHVVRSNLSLMENHNLSTVSKAHSENGRLLMEDFRKKSVDDKTRPIIFKEFKRNQNQKEINNFCKFLDKSDAQIVKLSVRHDHRSYMYQLDPLYKTLSQHPTIKQVTLKLNSIATYDSTSSIVTDMKFGELELLKDKLVALDLSGNVKKQSYDFGQWRPDWRECAVPAFHTESIVGLTNLTHLNLSRCCFSVNPFDPDHKELFNLAKLPNLVSLKIEEKNRKVLKEEVRSDLKKALPKLEYFSS